MPMEIIIEVDEVGAVRIRDEAEAEVGVMMIGTNRRIQAGQRLGIGAIGTDHLRGVGKVVGVEHYSYASYLQLKNLLLYFLQLG